MEIQNFRGVFVHTGLANCAKNVNEMRSADQYHHLSYKFAPFKLMVVRVCNILLSTEEKKMWYWKHSEYLYHGKDKRIRTNDYWFVNTQAQKSHRLEKCNNAVTNSRDGEMRIDAMHTRTRTYTNYQMFRTLLCQLLATTNSNVILPRAQ